MQVSFIEMQRKANCNFCTYCAKVNKILLRFICVAAFAVFHAALFGFVSLCFALLHFASHYLHAPLSDKTHQTKTYHRFHSIHKSIVLSQHPEVSVQTSAMHRHSEYFSSWCEVFFCDDSRYQPASSKIASPQNRLASFFKQISSCKCYLPITCSCIYCL